MEDIEKVDKEEELPADFSYYEPDIFEGSSQSGLLLTIDTITTGIRASRIKSLQKETQSFLNDGKYFSFNIKKDKYNLCYNMKF